MSEDKPPRVIPKTEIRQMLVCTFNIGENVEGDPVRVATSYSELDGTLVAFIDPYKPDDKEEEQAAPKAS